MMPKLRGIDNLSFKKKRYFKTIFYKIFIYYIYEYITNKLYISDYYFVLLHPPP